MSLRPAAPRLAALALALSLPACTTLTDNLSSPGLPRHPWLGETVECMTKPSEACTVGHAARAIAVAQTYCMDLRGYYERGGVVTGNQRLFMGVLGSLAGSVFAVTAGGTAAKAWSGLSGATNGIQTQLDQAGANKTSPQVLARIAEEQVRYAAEFKAKLAAKDYTAAVQLALVLPDSCNAAAGVGLAKEADSAASAAQRVQALDRKREASTPEPPASGASAASTGPLPPPALAAMDTRRHMTLQRVP